jgi:hypothetical protein
MITEDKLQSDCYMWFHNEYPELRGLLCYNLNNSRNRIRASVDKSMGLQKGRSDMVLYHKGAANMIEMKLTGENQLPGQVKWESQIKSQGFKYFVCRSLDEFQEIIRSIL